MQKTSDRAATHCHVFQPLCVPFSTCTKHGPKSKVGGAKPRYEGTTKAGNPCQSTLLVDGHHCVFHAPNGLDPVELGRKGGRRSTIARRSLSRNEQQQIREGREKLREQFEADPDLYER